MPLAGPIRPPAAPGRGSRPDRAAARRGTPRGQIRKVAPGPLPALDRDRPAVRLRDRLRDRQAEPVPPLFLERSASRREKRRRSSGGHLGGYLARLRDLDRSRRRPLNGHTDPCRPECVAFTAFSSRASSAEPSRSRSAETVPCGRSDLPRTLRCGAHRRMSSTTNGSTWNGLLRQETRVAGRREDQQPLRERER